MLDFKKGLLRRSFFLIALMGQVSLRRKWTEYGEFSRLGKLRIYEVLILKNPKIIVTISCLFILIVGIISIYFLANRTERPALVLMFGSFMILLQQVFLKVIKK